MTDKREGVSGQTQAGHWDASDQSLLSATMMATPAQRLAWLEEALRLAYATGALMPRRFLSKEEWDAMGSSSLDNAKDCGSKQPSRAITHESDCV